MSPEDKNHGYLVASHAPHASQCHAHARLVEEADDLARDVLPPGLLVIHDAGRGGEDDVAELTRGQQLDNPLLEITESDVVAGRDDTGLVETAIQLNDDLAVAVVINLLELANVAFATSQSMLRVAVWDVAIE